MKKIVYALPLFLISLSCEVEGDLTRNSLQSSSIPENAPSVFKGDFIGTSGVTVTGGVKIYLNDNQYKIRLNDFRISSGPDLKVYLSKTATPSDFVNLGSLTSTAVYVIPPQVDVSVYKYVLIHCQQYNHLFAIAQFSKN